MINYKSQEEMIEALQESGIQVRPILKAFVPDRFEDGGPGQGIIEMTIEEAYRKICCSVMNSYDPFTNTFNGK